MSNPPSLDGLTVVGTPIPEGTTFLWGHKKDVRHFLLSVRMFPHSKPPQQMPADGYEPGTIKFTAQEITKPPYDIVDTVDDMCAYAGVLAGRVPLFSVSDAKTPYDITITEPTWLVLELDRSINWRFSNTYLACTTKEDEPPYPPQADGPRYGYNTNLRYAYPGMDAVPYPTGADCRFIFFGVAHRRTQERQGFNLFVEFFENDGGVIKILPLTIDPDVGNDGSNEFPTPP
jgi:hypothetical protein